MSSLPADIRQRVVDDFGEERAADVYDHLLANVPEGLPNGTRPRHLRCILFLATGHMKQLDDYLKMCLCDTRDVMLAAEYESVPGGDLKRVRDFSRPFNDSEIQ